MYKMGDLVITRCRCVGHLEINSTETIMFSKGYPARIISEEPNGYCQIKFIHSGYGQQQAWVHKSNLEHDLLAQFKQAAEDLE